MKFFLLIFLNVDPKFFNQESRLWRTFEKQKIIKIKKKIFYKVTSGNRKEHNQGLIKQPNIIARI